MKMQVSYFQFSNVNSFTSSQIVKPHHALSNKTTTPDIYYNQIIFPFCVVLCLETVQHNGVRMANFLIHQKFFNVCPLIPTKLNNL
mmetsp:Transcript_5327/g.11649  ORF Transcript_5327/g.11649 Transcript_5327/m.11649 type:complete len:86 (-) Transcript_5327:381-638(-)